MIPVIDAAAISACQCIFPSSCLSALLAIAIADIICLLQDYS